MVLIVFVRKTFLANFVKTLQEVFHPVKACFKLGGRDLPNGNYNILHKNGTKATSMYCQMPSLEGCAGGGWTMVMKIDGSKTTFDYNSTYWTDRTGYLNIHGRFGFDDVETKMPSYWSASFKEICIGMKVGNDLRFVMIPYAGESLRDLIAEDKFLATNVGREKWKSLIMNSSLQSNCYKEGFNIYDSDIELVIARIGIVGDEQASFIELDIKELENEEKMSIEQNQQNVRIAEVNQAPL
ncbi:Hypothetical predicted protein [Paramuricea clavata]|uniref:Uncharacterized protein n=1 Tax=Paramuricea clavata TaxID=317549 RepID=A0A7D9I944_PARCT|nr:Hypothetical predicted protein [Paramuricea clavata]